MEKCILYIGIKFQVMYPEGGDGYHVKKAYKDAHAVLNPEYVDNPPKRYTTGQCGHVCVEAVLCHLLYDQRGCVDYTQPCYPSLLSILHALISDAVNPGAAGPSVSSPKRGVPSPTSSSRPPCSPEKEQPKKHYAADEQAASRKMDKNEEEDKAKRGEEEEPQREKDHNEEQEEEQQHRLEEPQQPATKVTYDVLLHMVKERKVREHQG